MVKVNDMNKIDKKELILALVIIVLAVLATDPFMVFMPSMFQMMMSALLLVAFLIFSAFFWKEDVQDEREELHRLRSGKAGFFVGALVLIIGIIVQAFSHNIDSWLVVALVAMVAAKAISLYKSRNNN